jgi:CDP-paratose synthetase
MPPAGVRGPVLVVGAAGFLGRQVASLLVRRGTRVVAALRRPTAEPIPGCEVRYFDGLEPSPLLLGHETPAAIINVATVYGREGHVADVMQSNMAMPIRLMEAAVRAGCRTWVEGGSYYVTAPGPGPLPAYVLSKRQARSWAAILAEQYGADVRIAELQHMYGPGDRPDKFVPTLLAGCVRGERIPLSLGEQVRDFIHVQDAAAGVIALLDAPRCPGVRVVDVGTGIGTSIRRFAELVVELTGGRAVLDVGARPHLPHDPMRAVADTTMLRSLGWSATYDLRSGVAQTLSVL